MKIKKILFSILVSGIAVVIVTCLNANNVRALSGTNSIVVTIDFDYGGFKPVNIHLLGHRPGQDNFEVIETCQVTKPILTFNGLEQYGEGVAYDYEVMQDQVPGYQTTYEQVGNQIKIINKLVMNGQLEFPDAKIDLYNGAVLAKGNYPDFEIETLLTIPGGETVEVVNYVNSNGEVIINAGMAYHVTKPGSYLLTLNQNKQDYQNFSFDESRYTVAYQVEYDGSGDLEVHQGTISKDGESVSDIRYLNIYNSNITRVEIYPTLSISGLNPMAEKFKIAIFDILPFGELLNSEIEIDYPATDNCSFGIDMYPDTEYAVNIRQEPNDSAYYTYDQSEYTVKMVTDSYGIPTITITKNGDIENNIEFENIYQAVPVTSQIQIKKEIVGGDNNPIISFTFQLSQIDTNQPKTIKNKYLTINAEGSTVGTGVFDLTFSQPGNYNFQINEVAGDNPDYSYDETVYQVEAIVSDCKGVLVAKCQCYKNDIMTDWITFRNIHIIKNNSAIVDTSDSISYIYEDILLGLGTLTLLFYVYKKIKAVT